VKQSKRAVNQLVSTSLTMNSVTALMTSRNTAGEVKQSKRAVKMLKGEADAKSKVEFMVRDRVLLTPLRFADFIAFCCRQLFPVPERHASRSI
jgi:hypothetical protein